MRHLKVGGNSTVLFVVDAPRQPSAAVEAILGDWARGVGLVHRLPDGGYGPPSWVIEKALTTIQNWNLADASARFKGGESLEFFGLARGELDWHNILSIPPPKAMPPVFIEV